METVRSVCVTRFDILKNMFISNSLQLELPLALSAESKIGGESKGKRERGNREGREEE